MELLDSALHAPQASFGEEDFYPSIEQMATVLGVRIAAGEIDEGAAEVWIRERIDPAG